MFLVKLRSGPLPYWVFLREDPGGACAPWEAVGGVDYDPGPTETLRWWTAGTPVALSFGRSRADAKKFRLFADSQAMEREGFEPVEGLPWIHRTWQEFVNSPQGRRVVRRPVAEAPPAAWTGR